MNNIYQHFRKEEQSFIDQVLDWITQVSNQYVPYLTVFLNPRELYIAQTIVGQHEDIRLQKFGGYSEAEQKRILIYPEYYEPENSDFEISLFEINYPKNFATLSHGQILGTILGTGISRGNLGDILTDGQRWQFLIDSKMEDFIIMNIEKMGRSTVQLEKKTLTDTIENTDKWQRKDIIISSLRIDTVIAKSMNLSRNDAVKLINQNRIKLNWASVDRPDIGIEEFDILSVRGYGRIQILKEKGTTRKDNLIVEIGLIDRNT